MHEVSEVYYSCDYCKRIHQMAARYRLVDCRMINAVIHQEKKQSFCLTLLLQHYYFILRKEKLLLPVLALVNRIPNTS